MTRAPRPATIWWRPRTPGDAEILRGFGGVVSPVLAGFSLATIVVLETVEGTRPDHADFAVAALAVTTVALVFSMQFSFAALRHHGIPAERLAWGPEATADPEALRIERWNQRMDLWLVELYARRARFTYNLAIVAFAVALVLLLVPEDGTGAQRLAFGVAVAGLVGEVTLAVLVKIPVVGRLAWPGYKEANAGVLRLEPRLPVVPVDTVLRQDGRPARRVVVASADGAVHDAVRTVLARLVVDVIPASTPTEAVARAAASPPAVLLVDARLDGDGDGGSRHVCRDIRAEQAAGRLAAFPVVLVVPPATVGRSRSDPDADAVVAFPLDESDMERLLGPQVVGTSGGAATAPPGEPVAPVDDVGPITAEGR